MSRIDCASLEGIGRELLGGVPGGERLVCASTNYDGRGPRLTVYDRLANESVYHLPPEELQWLLVGDPTGRTVADGLFEGDML